MGIFLRCDGM